METPFNKRRFENIQALRGIAAVFIILEHIRIANNGAFGVDIFFCISGFMAMFSTQIHQKYFLGKRIVRILPLYYLMTFATYAILLVKPDLFSMTSPRPAYLWKSLCMIPFEITPGVTQPLMRVGWTVNCEFFFYLIFWIAMKISQKYRGLISSSFILAVCVAGMLVKNPPVFLRFYGDCIMLEFIFGILVFYLVQYLYNHKIEQALSNRAAHSILLTAIALLFLLAATKRSMPEITGSQRIFVWGIPSAAIVVCFFMTEDHIRFPKILLYIGNMSFSVYLIHYYPVRLMDTKVFHFDRLTAVTTIEAVVCIVICLLLSAVCYEVVEKRLLAPLSRKLFQK